MEAFGNQLRSPDEFRTYCDFPRNSPSVPLTSPVPFEAGQTEQYHYSPTSNLTQSLGVTPDMYWPYGNDTGRTSFTNSYSTPGQYSYWRSSPYPNADVMMSKDWSSPSPESCNYSAATWPVEAMPMGQGCTVHPLSHGVPQWTAGMTIGSCDQSGSGETSVNDTTVQPIGKENSRDGPSPSEHLDASPWKPINPLPPIAEILSSLRYSPCMWLGDSAAVTSPDTVKPGPNDAVLTHNITDKGPLKQEQAGNTGSNEHSLKGTQTYWRLKKGHTKGEKEKELPKSSTKRLSSKKPELYKRQKLLQREREYAIREAINHLNMLLPDDNQGRKLSKNMVLLKAIDHISDLKKNVHEVDMSTESQLGDDKAGVHAKKNENKSKKSKEDVKGVKRELIKESSTKRPSSGLKVFHPNTKPSCSPPRLSDSPPNLWNSPSPQYLTDSPPRLSESPPDNMPIEWRGPDLHSLMEAIQDPAFLTPSDSSSGSERAESPPLDGGAKSGEKHSHRIKRPMNAFLLFSKSNRENFKKMYPGRDNRKISTMLGEHWNCLKVDDKRPFQEMARELMRKTKATYPEFKYSPNEQVGKCKVTHDGREKSPRKPFTVGCHILRTRQDRARHSHVKTQTGHKRLTSCGLPKPVTPKKRKPGASLEVMDEERQKRRKQMTPKKADLEHFESSPSQEDTEASRSENNEQCDLTKERSEYAFVSRSCDNWVQCDKCKKWRMLLDNVNPLTLPEKWYCWLNDDVDCDDCSLPEEMRWIDCDSPVEFLLPGTHLSIYRKLKIPRHSEEDSDTGKHRHGAAEGDMGVESVMDADVPFIVEMHKWPAVRMESKELVDTKRSTKKDHDV